MRLRASRREETSSTNAPATTPPIAPHVCAASSAAVLTPRRPMYTVWDHMGPGRGRRPDVT